MVSRCLWVFALLALCCFNTSAGVFFTSVLAQEVEQGGSGAGAEGKAAEAEEAYKLGVLLEQGGDNAGAFDWFASAAERGHIEATYRLGRAYAEGRGVARNDKLAVPLLQTAVKAGHAGAMGSLGMMYFGARGGLPKSIGKAEELFRNAAQHGNAQAMYNLGNLYARDSGGREADLVTAYVLLELAAQKGVQPAQALGQSIDAKLSLAQRSQINAVRTQWKNSIEANK